MTLGIPLIIIGSFILILCIILAFTISVDLIKVFLPIGFVIFIIMLIIGIVYLLKEKSEKFNDENKDLTIVTAFITIQSKHSKDQYKNWMKGLLSYNGPMIIFADSNNIENISKLRENLPTKLILTKLDDLYTNKYKGKFNHHLGFYSVHDKMEKVMNLDEYSMIQCEKPNFLKISADENPFNTNYFMWYDIGYIRSGKLLPQSWPNVDKLKILNDKIFVMSLKNEGCKNVKKSMYTYSEPPNDVMITGGIMGSHKNNINTFHKLFYDKLENIIEEGKEWAGMEQFILSHIYCENMDKFHILKAKKNEFVNNDEWFYGIPYFM